MKIFNKIRIDRDDSIVKKYKFFGMSLLRKEKLVNKIKWNFLGITICKRITDNGAIKNSENIELKKLFGKIKNKRTKRKIILYVDHSLGGGTETYFRNQVQVLGANYNVLRIQYFLFNGMYKISLYNNTSEESFGYYTFSELEGICARINTEIIVFNNIVAYPNPYQILEMIADYKKKHPHMRVVYKLHDYYAICPSYALLDYKNQYCKVCKSDSKSCKCYKNFDFKNQNIQENFKISEWRKKWGDFLNYTVDEISVFSKSSIKILLKAYPFVKEKIKLVPHTIKEFPKYNIAILGHLPVLKGATVIVDLLSYLELNDINKYRFVLFGNNCMNINSDKLKVIGPYERNDLPILLKNENIDCVFIPSIWPETFSYTTREAIALDYPVMCFDLGGQADQVSKYSKGKILSSFKPDAIVKEFDEFFKNIGA